MYDASSSDAPQAASVMCKRVRLGKEGDGSQVLSPLVLRSSPAKQGFFLLPSRHDSAEILACVGERNDFGVFRLQIV